VVQPATPPQLASSPPSERLAMQQPATVTPVSLQLPTGQPAMGSVHRPALQQPAMLPPSSQQPTSEDDTQLLRVVEELHASPHAQRRRSVAVLEEVQADTQPRHLAAGQRTMRASPFLADVPFEPAVPPPRAEGQADGEEDAPSSTQLSPAKGARLGLVRYRGCITFYPCIDGLFSFTG
jgi:hypothetical protein